jgi:threonine dehydratase
MSTTEPASNDEDIPTCADVEAAAEAFLNEKDERGRSAIIRTPTLYSRVLSDHFDQQVPEKQRGIQIFVKHENMQVTAAYKERGALNKLLQLKKKFGKDRIKGVVAASAGNHAQGLACHARRHGIRAIIFMPKGTPTLKVSRTRQHGADVRMEGNTFDVCKGIAQEFAAREGLEFVHPFDDPAIVAGQGTVGLEMLQDAKQSLETLVVPIGGGGLISGVAIAAKAMHPGIKIIGVEARLFPTLYNARHGVLGEIKGGDTIAEGIAVKQPGKLTSRIVNATNADGSFEYVDDILLVDEELIEEAIGLLVELEKTVVEGAGAVGLAALLQYANDRTYGRYFQGKRVGIILSGGNIDTRLLSNILIRDLLIENRMARINIVLKDEPGQLLKVLEVLRDENINVVDIAQERLFNRLLAKNVGARIDCEAADPAAFDAAMRKLRSAGFDDVEKLPVREVPRLDGQ